MTEQTDFDRFWDLYPRKVGKKAAQKAFDKAVEDDEVQDIMAGLHEFVKLCHGKEAKFIPHGQTWLNQGRWSDEEYIKVEKATERPKYKIGGYEWADKMMRTEWGLKALREGHVNDFTIWAERNPGEYPDDMLFEGFAYDKAATRKKLEEAANGGKNIYAPLLASYYRNFLARETRIAAVYEEIHAQEEENPF